MNCPWEGWSSIELGFCEEVLCSWIKQPGNTWSSIGYVFVGLWMWNRSEKDRCLGLRMFAAASIITGLGSAFFHASGTAFGGRGDYLGMFLESGAMTALNLRRWKKVSWKWTHLAFLLTAMTLLSMASLFPTAERWIYALGSPCYLIEIRLYFLYGKKTNYRCFLLSWLLVLAAMLFWWLDVSGRYCDPGNHFLSGHVLWHLLSAASLVALYFYYLQFSSLRTSE